MIETLGYGGKRPHEFFAEVHKLNPDLIIDVRENPFKAFLAVYTKPVLEKIYPDRYMWLPACGNKTRKMPPELVDEAFCLKRIRYLATKHKRIVLLCAEKDERRCHRSYIKEKLEG